MIKDQDRTPVAQDVITMCTRCKMELKHVVVAQDMEGFVKTVKCYTCGSEHRYRRAKKTTAANRTVRKTAVKRADTGRDFQARLERLSDRMPVPYLMSESYNIDDVIEHATFGKGVVTNVSFQKMEVLFADGSRVLAMDKNLG